MQTHTKRKMFNKLDLPVDEICQMLDEGMRQIDVATLFDVDQSTISRLKSKKNTSIETPKNVSPPRKLCTGCGKRAIAKGNRFLCSTCYCH